MKQNLSYHMPSEGGLGELWSEIQRVLLEVRPFYEEGNRAISFGRDIRYRHEGIVKAVRSGDLVLDAGCGPGTMSKIILESVKGVGGVVLMDPLLSMLQTAIKKVDGQSAAAGIFEKLPFRGGSFDVVVCGFSLRDALSFESAVGEITRVLKPDGGRLLMVDLGKPDNLILRWLIGLYWRFFAGMLAALRLGRRGFAFSRIYGTYIRYLRTSCIRRILEARFESVSIETRLLGGVLIVVAEKPRHG